MAPTAVREKPPVVQPGVGNNIIINPNQVSPLITRNVQLTDISGALEPSPRNHTQCGQRIRRYRPRFSGWPYDVYIIPQVHFFFVTLVVGF